jgi:hypothetical protein
MASDKVKITVSSVLGMLKEGKTREEIRQHYGLSKTELKALFQHPKLKGRKTHKAPSFTLVDDLDDNSSEGTHTPDATAMSGATASSAGSEQPQSDDFFARRNESIEEDI